jgi:hypothetical protein
LATLDFRYALERYLQEPALPVRIMERRAGYRAHTFDTSMSGLGWVLSSAGMDKEPGLDGGTPLHVPNVGDIELAVAVIREAADRTEKRYPAGVFFVVNGQMHSQLGVEFFKRRRLKLDYIADSLIVRADCTNLPADVREDLFLASRDRMRDIDEKALLEDQISEYLAEHPGLRELNARRREKAIAESSDEDAQGIADEDTVDAGAKVVSSHCRSRSGVGDARRPGTVCRPHLALVIDVHLALLTEAVAGANRRPVRTRWSLVEWDGLDASISVVVACVEHPLRMDTIADDGPLGTEECASGQDKRGQEQ